MNTTVVREEVTATALDYFEGWFNGDAERMERALQDRRALAVAP